MKTNLKEYSKQTAQELTKVIMNFKFKAAKGEGTFEVIATTEGMDRDGEIILIKGWDFENFMKNPVVLFGHDYWSFPIGAVTELIDQGDKVLARGVFARTEEGQKARVLYEDEILKTVSVGFIPKERQGNIITKAELLELSFVPVPSNPDALDARKELEKFEKMLKTNARIMKDVVQFEETIKAGEDIEWEPKAALEKVTTFAKGDGEEIDFKKFKQAFAWFNSEDPENIESYKLLHHIAVGDSLQVVWQGVIGSMAKLLDEENDLGIPEDEKQAVYNHLAKHYEQFEKEPPTFKSYTRYELDNLFPEVKAEVSLDQKEMVNSIVQGLKKDVGSLLADAVERIESVTGINSKGNVQPISKAGRTISAKTRRSISNAVDAMGKAVTELNALLELDSSGEDDEKMADLKDVLKSLQGLDKVAEQAIKTVKERIGK